MVLLVLAAMLASPAHGEVASEEAGDQPRVEWGEVSLIPVDPPVQQTDDGAEAVELISLDLPDDSAIPPVVQPAVPSVYELPEDNADLKALREQCERDRQNADLRVLLARHLAKLEDAAGAVAECNRALAVQPDHLAARFWKARALIDMDVPKEALEVAGAALAAHPRHVDFLLLRARILNNLDKCAQALADLREAVKWDPDCARAYCMMGEVYDTNENHLDPHKAIQCYTIALRKRPLFPEALYYRALQYYVLGDRDKADADLAQIIEKLPADSEWVHKAREFRAGLRDFE